MTATDSSNNGDASSAPKPSVEELQSDVERTREELADTIDQLAAKADVKGRTKAKVAQTRDRAGELASQTRDAATTDDGKPTPVTLAVAVGAVVTAVAVGVLVWRRRR